MPDKIFFVCGADFVQGMTNPNYWATESLIRFFKYANVLCFLRTTGIGGISE